MPGVFSLSGESQTGAGARSGCQFCCDATEGRACILEYSIPTSALATIRHNNCDTRSQDQHAREDLMVSSNTAATPAQFSSGGFRWLQLGMGIVCMAMIANLQYGWTLFVDPIDGAHHWGRAAIQFAFTIFVVTETWLVPVEDWFVNKYGPRIVIMFGGVMITLSWVLNSYADSLTLLYTAAIIGGIGAGAVYGTCVGNALKWFPDRRGLAAGATAGGNHVGDRHQTAFFDFGIGQGVIVFLLAFLIQKP